MKMVMQTDNAVVLSLSRETFETFNQCLIAVMELHNRFDLDMPLLSKDDVERAIDDSQEATHQFYQHTQGY